MSAKATEIWVHNPSLGRAVRKLGTLCTCSMQLQVYMSAKAWGDVHYSRVPSVCMRMNKDKFEKHDKERFQQYLDDVKAGKKKIASGALKPHKLVQEAMILFEG